MRADIGVPTSACALSGKTCLWRSCSDVPTEEVTLLVYIISSSSSPEFELYSACVLYRKDSDVLGSGNKNWVKRERCTGTSCTGPSQGMCTMYVKLSL